MSYTEKEKLIKDDIASIENRVRHAFNQGYDLGFKDGKERAKSQGQEPRWIPTSERLPVEDADVLVTLKCGLIGIMQKKLADDDNDEQCYIIWQNFEGEEHEVVAWMPMPQPYKAESEE